MTSPVNQNDPHKTNQQNTEEKGQAKIRTRPLGSGNREDSLHRQNRTGDVPGFMKGTIASMGSSKQAISPRTLSDAKNLSHQKSDQKSQSSNSLRKVSDTAQTTFSRQRPESKQSFEDPNSIQQTKKKLTSRRPKSPRKDPTSQRVTTSENQAKPVFVKPKSRKRSSSIQAPDSSVYKYSLAKAKKDKQILTLKDVEEIKQAVEKKIQEEKESRLKELESLRQEIDSLKEQLSDQTASHQKIEQVEQTQLSQQQQIAGLEAQQRVLSTDYQRFIKIQEELIDRLLCAETDSDTDSLPEEPTLHNPILEIDDLLSFVEGSDNEDETLPLNKQPLKLITQYSSEYQQFTQQKTSEDVSDTTSISSLEPEKNPISIEQVLETPSTPRLIPNDLKQTLLLNLQKDYRLLKNNRTQDLLSQVFPDFVKTRLNTQEAEKKLSLSEKIDSYYYNTSLTDSWENFLDPLFKALTFQKLSFTNAEAFRTFAGRIAIQEIYRRVFDPDLQEKILLEVKDFHLNKLSKTIDQFATAKLSFKNPEASWKAFLNEVKPLLKEFISEVYQTHACDPVYMHKKVTWYQLNNLVHDSFQKFNFNLEEIDREFQIENPEKAQLSISNPNNSNLFLIVRQIQTYLQIIQTLDNLEWFSSEMDVSLPELFNRNKPLPLTQLNFSGRPFPCIPHAVLNANLNNVVSIQFDNTGLTEFPTFFTTENLRILSLSGNSIQSLESIKDYLLQNTIYQSLQCLKLDDNPDFQWTPSVIALFPSLEYLSATNTALANDLLQDQKKVNNPDLPREIGICNQIPSARSWNPFKKKPKEGTFQLIIQKDYLAIINGHIDAILKEPTAETKEDETKTEEETKTEI